MSHFAVLVIGENPEKQLQPFHEFECTGIDDEYVQEIDITEKCREEYNSATTNRLKDSAGNLHYPYGDEFYREPTPEEKEKIGFGGIGCVNGIQYKSKDWNDGNGYRAKVLFVPEGWNEVEILQSETESFLEYVTDYYGISELQYGETPDLQEAHKYGYALVKNGEVIKIIDRTNPNKKWDWHQLGGRYTGHLKLKPIENIHYEPYLGFSSAEVSKFVDLYQNNFHKFLSIAKSMGARGGEFSSYIGKLANSPNNKTKIKLGKPGLGTDAAKSGYADSALKSYVDFEGMRQESATKASERYDKAMKAFSGMQPNESWESVRERIKDIQQARDFYNNQPRVKACREYNEFIWNGPDEFLIPKSEYIQNASDSAIATFAVVKDGIWYEKGQMGWWAAVSNKKDESAWNSEFNQLIDSLPDNTLLSVYDCHI